MVRLTDRPDMTLGVYRGRKTTIQPTKYINQVPLLLHKAVFGSKDFREQNFGSNYYLYFFDNKYEQKISEANFFEKILGGKFSGANSFG